MSRFFGEIRQNGYVVRDIDAAIRHWTEVIGVGPFYVLENAPIPNASYRGQPADIRVSVALAHSGPLQVELIELENGAPSPYREFLDAGREGLHHVAYIVSSIDEAVARGGIPVVMAGASDTIRFAYLDSETHPGSVVELIERSAAVDTFFGKIEAASRQWSGAEPIRPFASLFI
jgi:hypothetical protein